MRRFTASLCFLTACALAGCSGSGFDDTSDDSADQGGGPAAGEFVNFLIPSADSCGLASTLSGALDVSKVDIAADGSSMTVKGNDSELSCKSVGANHFSCERPPQMLATDPDATATVAIGFDLTWKSSDRIEGVVSASVTCTGTGCAKVAADFPNGLPCSAEGRFVSLRAMPESFAPDIDTGYAAHVGQPLLTTCGAAPAIPADQTLRIERVDDTTAKVFSDGSDVPFDCKFEGKGRTRCERRAKDGKIAMQSEVSLAWTGARGFEGSAIVRSGCEPGEDCTGSPFELSCASYYQLRGAAN